jgi:hydrogenase expression/formation protein HypC
MCLGVPGRLVRWIDRDPLMAVAEIDFGGVTKPCHMACVPEAQVGNYVLVHAGIALTVIDEQAARKTLDDLLSVASRSAPSSATAAPNAG